MEMAFLNPNTVRKISDLQKRIPSHLPFTSRTFCPRLWSSVFITAKGEIYTCCRHVPIPSLGNLNRMPLTEAWNSWNSRFWRWMSTKGGLFCFDKCHLLTAQERAVAYEPESFPLQNPYENLKNVTILFGEFCNIACAMCDQNHRSKVMLSDELVKTQIDWRPIENINIQGGEPLAMKACKRAYLYITEEQGKKVNFLTNGMLINDEWADIIARNSSRITVSLNATNKKTHEQINVGSNWDRVIDNSKRLIASRDRQKTELRIVAHFTMVRENIETVPEFIGLAEEMKFDEVNFGYDYCIPDHLRQNKELMDSLKERTRAALAAAAIDVDMRQLNKLSLTTEVTSEESP